MHGLHRLSLCLSAGGSSPCGRGTSVSCRELQAGRLSAGHPISALTVRVRCGHHHETGCMCRWQQ